MSLYAAEPVLDGAVNLLRSVLPAKVDGKPLTVAKDATTFTAGLVLVELVVSPVPVSFHMGGHDWSTVGFQVTSGLWTRSQARLIGDLIRTAFVARTRGGKFATPMVIPGHTVLDVGSMSDGFADSSTASTGVIYQWAETFTIRFT